MNDGSAFDKISFRLLTELTEKPTITQRALADRLGIALGLVNAYIKKLYKKGHIKIKALPKNRIKYILTPNGFAAKTRLTYNYIHHSIGYFKEMRRRIENTYLLMVASGIENVLLWGDGEIAELCYISSRGLPLKIVGVIGVRRIENGFFGHHIYSTECLKDITYDAVLVTSIMDNTIKNDINRTGIDSNRIYYL